MTALVVGWAGVTCAQEGAALGCGGSAGAVEYAEAIRAAIRDILRRAPGW